MSQIAQFYFLFSFHCSNSLIRELQDHSLTHCILNPAAPTRWPTYVKSSNNIVKPASHGIVVVSWNGSKRLRAWVITSHKILSKAANLIQSVTTYIGTGAIKSPPLVPKLIKPLTVVRTNRLADWLTTGVPVEHHPRTLNINNRIDRLDWSLRLSGISTWVFTIYDHHRHEEFWGRDAQNQNR